MQDIPFNRALTNIKYGKKKKDRKKKGFIKGPQQKDLA